MNKDEYQTPKRYIIAAREVMRIIDLDAACSVENFVRLKSYISTHFSIENNALERDWLGNVWLNPPYSKPNLTLFTRKLIEQHLFERFDQPIYLVPSYTAEKWYQSCLMESSALCLPNHRINHLINGKIKDSPRFSSTFFYFGPQPERFCKVFNRFGKVLLNQQEVVF